MIYDVHCHMVGAASANGNFVAPGLGKGLLGRMLMRQFAKPWNGDRTTGADEAFKGRIVGWINESRIDRAVLLALDGAYREDGALDAKGTRMTVGNDYVAATAAENEKVLFGASIHPYRHDALEELDRLVERGACLVKWLPSAQNIRLDHPKCISFFKRLAHYKVPLLCHTGNEHALLNADNALNDPRHLRGALEQGVLVIAAHCGARMFLHERCWFSAWKQMALEWPNLFGDVGAFILPTRMKYLKALLKDPRLLSKAVYGSDFPTVVMPSSCLFNLGLKKTLHLRNTQNPFDRPYLILKEMGFPEEFFSRAGALVRLAQKKSGVLR